MLVMRCAYQSGFVHVMKLSDSSGKCSIRGHGTFVKTPNLSSTQSILHSLLAEGAKLSVQAEKRAAQQVAAAASAAMLGPDSQDTPPADHPPRDVPLAGASPIRARGGRDSAEADARTVRRRARSSTGSTDPAIHAADTHLTLLASPVQAAPQCASSCRHAAAQQEHSRWIS